MAFINSYGHQNVGKTNKNFRFPIIARRRHGHYSYCCWRRRRRRRTFQVIDNNWNNVESVDVVFYFPSSSLLLISNIGKYGQKYKTR